MPTLNRDTRGFSDCAWFRRAFLSTVLVLLFPIAVDAAEALHDERETRLVDVRQLTHGGENAEAYWSPDGSELVFQSNRAPFHCDQIYRMPISDPLALPWFLPVAGELLAGISQRMGITWYFPRLMKPALSVQRHPIVRVVTSGRSTTLIRYTARHWMVPTWCH